jgi:Domain of unknown function DUF29
MATQLRPKAKNLYDDDFYVWTEVQAELLRRRQLEALDLDNLIEEVEGLADTKLAAVLSNAAVVIEHLLKLQHSPATDPRNSWRASVREHRRRLWIESTPRLTQILADRLPELYARARDDAAAGMRDHGEHAAADALPAACPYSLDQLTGDWWP